MKQFFISAAVIAASIAPAMANDHQHHMHQHHCAGEPSHVHTSNIPASIMGDHTHSKGDWMVSYRPMHMRMSGNRDGNSNLSLTDISGSYAGGAGQALRIVPTEMEMTMHMFSAMYAPTDRLTLMLMGSYQEKEMSLSTFSMMNSDSKIGEFTTKSQGWGDTKIAALYQLADKKPYSIVAKLGISLPTGSTDETGDVYTPMSGGSWTHMRLPYSMQIGSGTYDVEPAFTYTDNDGDYSWGTQYSAVIRTGRNNQGYTLGNKHRASIWGGYQINEAIGSTLRLTGEYESKIKGRDDQITGAVQTANPDYYGGKRAELGLGFNFALPEMKDHAIGIEATAPIYQNLNGPQMKRDYGVSLRYSYSF